VSVTVSPETGRTLQAGSDLSTLAEDKRKADELAGYEDARRIRPELTLEEYRALSIFERTKLLLNRAPSEQTCQLGTTELQNYETTELQNNGTKELRSTSSSSSSSSTPIPADGVWGGAPAHEIACSSSSSSSSSSNAERSWDLYELIDSYESGQLAPTSVHLGKLPRMAPENERLVAADIALLIGLRRAVGETRPLIYSRGFLCERMGWDKGHSKSTADRILKRLLRWGVVERGPDLPGQHGERSWWTYVPPTQAIRGLPDAAASQERRG
jgi:hypothetical protein